MEATDGCIDNNSQSIHHNQNYIEPVQPIIVNEDNKEGNEKDEGNKDEDEDNDNKDSNAIDAIDGIDKGKNNNNNDLLKQEPVLLHKEDMNNNNEDNNIQNEIKEDNNNEIQKKANQEININNSNSNNNDNNNENENDIKQQLSNKDSPIDTVKQEIGQYQEQQEQRKPKNDFMITGVDIEAKPKTDHSNNNDTNVNTKTTPINPSINDSTPLRNRLNKSITSNATPEMMKAVSPSLDQTLLQIKEEINENALEISNNQKRINDILHSSMDKENRHKSEMSPNALKTLTKLKKSQETLKNNIYTLKLNQTQLENEGFLNVSGSIIEDTIRQGNLKQINEKKRILIDRLEGIQTQVDHIINEERKIDRNTLIKCFLENFESDDNYELKSLEYDKQHQIRKEKMMNDITLTQEKRQREFEENEKKTMEQKEKFLLQLKRREREAISKRRKDIELKMQKTKNYINIKCNKRENDYLFHKMRNRYEEGEKKLIDRIKLIKKNKTVSKEEIMELNRRLEDQRVKSLHDSMEKAKLMKEMRKNRSQILPEYKSPIVKILMEERKTKKEEEEFNIMKPIIIAKDRKLFGEKKVPTPFINEKLKRERERRIIRIEHKERRKKRRIIKEPLVKVPIPRPRPIPRPSLPSKPRDKLNKSNSVQSLIRKPTRFIRSQKEITVRPEKPPNYLIELKKNHQAQSMNKTDWSKIINNPKGNTIQNIQLIQAQAEAIEEKVKNKMEFMRLNGGYEKNHQIGHSLSDLLLESIKAKIAIMKSFKSKT